MELAILLFEGVTALDAVGPFEVLSRLPGASTTFVGKTAGVVRTDNRRLGLSVDKTLRDLTSPDLLLIPGGYGARTLLDDQDVLSWVRSAHRSSTWTTSVCTGSLVLAAAGILDGIEATTHWSAMEHLVSLGAAAVPQRVVRRGKIWTAAGVSAGIDMALELAACIAGQTVAETIQLGIEYDPQPPFDAGSVAKAPREVFDALKAKIAKRNRQPPPGG